MKHGNTSIAVITTLCNELVCYIYEITFLKGDFVIFVPNGQHEYYTHL